MLIYTKIRTIQDWLSQLMMWLKYANIVCFQEILKLCLFSDYKKIRLESSYNFVLFREILKLTPLILLGGLQHCPPLALTVLLDLLGGLGLPRKHGLPALLQKLKSHGTYLLWHLQNRRCHRNKMFISLWMKSIQLWPENSTLLHKQHLAWL